MKIFIYVIALLIAVTSWSQTNRHGESNGTILELPDPRVDESSQKLVESVREKFPLMSDAEMARIESEFNSLIASLDSKLDRSNTHEFRLLSEQSHALKIEREIALLNRMRELATERNSLSELPTLDEVIATQTAKLYQISERIHTLSSRESGGVK